MNTFLPAVASVSGISCSITISQVKAAEAEAESKYLSGVGVSRQRKAIVDGLRDSVQTFSETIDGALTSPLWTTTFVHSP